MKIKSVSRKQGRVTVELAYDELYEILDLGDYNGTSYAIKKIKELRKETWLRVCPNDSTRINLLSHLLKCGYSDYLFLERKMKDFDVELDDLLDYVNELYRDKYDVNCYIGGVHEVALQNAGAYKDGMDLKIRTYYNYLDSHLTVEGEAMYTYQDIVDVVNKHKQDKQEEDDE
jgi:hypothetical protein